MYIFRHQHAYWIKYIQTCPLHTQHSVWATPLNDVFIKQTLMLWIYNSHIFLSLSAVWCWIFSICSIIITTIIIMPLMMITKYVESKWTQQSRAEHVMCCRLYARHIIQIPYLHIAWRILHTLKKKRTQANPTLFMACIGRSINNALARSLHVCDMIMLMEYDYWIKLK